MSAELNIEKAVKPEVSKDTLLEIIKELQELIIEMIEVEEPEAEAETEEPEDEESPEIKIEGNPAPIGDPEKNQINWPMSKSNDEDYESDNEEEDKWDNLEKACWTGYTQRGMKEKNGRMVPNCVPVEKMEDIPKEDQIAKSTWSGVFLK